MHIAFDISQTGSGKAGCGFFAHATLRALLEVAPEHRYTLLPSFGDFYFDPRTSLARAYRGPGVRYRARRFSREAAGAFWNRPDLDSALGDPDIVHANNFWCPTTLASSRLVYTCYDLGFTVEPGWTTEANRVGCFEGLFRAAAFADWVVAISEASRTHFLSVFPGFPGERTRVVYPSSRFEDSSAQGRRPASLAAVRPGAFWLNVGTLEPRKNQHRLAEAYARYRALGGAAMPLVLAGGPGWLMEGFRRHVEALGIAQDVVMTGYVSDEELIWLYRNCYANLYPSRFEGFGLPVLEGMQFGAATVASDASSLPEVAGDAALLLPPTDVDAWARAMLSLASEPARRESLRRAGPARAARFDRHAGARAMLALYAEAMASPRRAAGIAGSP